jgi:hypothetical protein
VSFAQHPIQRGSWVRTPEGEECEVLGWINEDPEVGWLVEVLIEDPNHGPGSGAYLHTELEIINVHR